MKKKSAATNPSLLPVIINALDDLKAQDIVVIDVTNLSDVMDTLVIASGSSNRQVRALAQHAAEETKKQGMRALGTEGLDDGEWALVDFGDVVLHVMQPEIRSFYELEKLWLIPGTSSTLDIASLKTPKKSTTKKTTTTKTASTKKPVAAKKPSAPSRAKTAKTSARKKDDSDILVSQSDASKARRKQAARPAAKKVATKKPAATAKAAPVKAGTYAKTGTRKPAAAKSAPVAASKKPAAKKTADSKSAASKPCAPKKS